MTSHCAECGAPWTAEDNCTQRYHCFLALEFSNPEYGVVHHLTVATYMFQHPSQLSSQGWQAIREQLRQFLDEGLRPAEARARIRKSAEFQKRSWSLKKGPRQQLPSDFAWTQTIMSVDDATGEPYRQGIEQWARQALADAAMVEL